MIVFPHPLLLSATLAEPLTHARIGWDTYTLDATDANVTASSETAAGPKDAPLRADTVEFWEPSSLPATWDIDFGSILDLDYVGIVGSLGSNGCAVEARISQDVADFNDYLSLSGDDANYASTPDSAAVSITGDLDIELELAIDNADLPAYFLDFVGDFDASVAKITGGSPTVGTFTRSGNTATRINTAGFVETVLANVMRQAFDAITRAAKGFQVEEARINVILQSEVFGTTWAKSANCTLASDDTTAPSGTLTADKLTPNDTTAAECGVQQATSLAVNTTYTMSCWAKKSSGSWLILRNLALENTGVFGLTCAWFDLQNGVVGTKGAAVTSSSIKAYPDGWYRCTMTGTTPAGSISFNRVDVRISNADAVLDHTNGQAVWVWGAQVEAGAFATSYIPTTTGSVTRNADACTVTDITSWFNASEGTLISCFENAPLGSPPASTWMIASLDDGTTNNRIQHRINSGTLDFLAVSGGVLQAAVGGVTPSASTKYKCAGCYKANDFYASIEGAAGSADASGTIPTVTKLGVGSGSGGFQMNGFLRSIDYCPTRRVNATLQDFSRQTYRCLASKWSETSNQRSWALCLTEHGSLILFVSTDGTAAGIREFHSVPLTITEGVRFRIRVQIDIVVGSPTLDAVCTFKTSDDDGASWTTLGTPVTQATIAGIFDSTAPIEVGAFNGGTSEFEGKVFQFWLYNAIDGSPVAHFDASEGDTGDTSIVSEDTGETWTIHSTGPATALTIKRFSTPVAPGDDAPIMMLDELKSARRLRLRFTGTAAPRVAVVYAGPVLAMQRAIRGGGHVPITMARETVLKQPLSRGGQFLGQSFRRMGVAGSVSFQLLEPAWVRANFDPFAKAARNRPYFYAWRPATYPLECGFCWATDDIKPSMQGIYNFMQVSWNMQGVGSE